MKKEPANAGAKTKRAQAREEAKKTRKRIPRSKIGDVNVRSGHNRPSIGDVSRAMGRAK